VARVGPVGDNLSFVVAWGESLTDYQGSSARGQSAVADLGLLGFFLTTPICAKTPPPLDKKYLPPMTRAESGAPGAEEGKRTTLVASPDAGVNGAAGDERAWATREPGARVATALASLGAPKALAIDGGRSDARTGATGTGREAVATSDVDVLDVLGGVLHLEGLRWDVAQHSDAAGRVDRTAGEFHIARATVNGREIPIGQAADGRSQIAAVNQALAATGLSLVAPVVSVRDGAVSVTPLGLRVTDSPGARATVAPVISALHPIRQPLADAIGEQSCSAALALEAVDIITDSMAGNGGVVLEVGGVAATTEGSRFASPFLEVPRVASEGAAAQVETAQPSAPAAGRPTPASPGAPGTPGRPALPGRTLAASRLAGGTRTLPGGTGGAAAIAAIAAAGVLVALAAGDRRRIRHRFRSSS
jgi:hypothetical protein